MPPKAATMEYVMPKACVAAARSFLRGWQYQETRVELMLGSIALLWGIYIMHSPDAQATEPIARAMLMAAHVTMPVIAVLLICVSITQGLATYFLLTWLRRICLVLVLFFYSFATFCFWRWAPHYPGSFICISYIWFAFWRLAEMSGSKQ
jgi:hypothetical protein